MEVASSFITDARSSLLPCSFGPGLNGWERVGKRVVLQLCSVLVQGIVVTAVQYDRDVVNSPSASPFRLLGIIAAV